MWKVHKRPLLQRKTRLQRGGDHCRQGRNWKHGGEVAGKASRWGSLICELSPDRDSISSEEDILGGRNCLGGNLCRVWVPRKEHFNGLSQLAWTLKTSIHCSQMSFSSWNSINVFRVFRIKEQDLRESSGDTWYLCRVAPSEFVRMMNFYSTFHFSFTAAHCWPLWQVQRGI